MFIELLTDADIEIFVLSLPYEFSLWDARRENNGFMHIKLFTNDERPCPEFWLSDFDLRTDTYYLPVRKGIKKEWQKFMHKKFGDEYIEAYRELYGTNKSL